MKTISLQIEHKPSFSFALEPSGVPLIGPVSIINNDSSPLEDVILEVGLYPDLGEPVTLQLPKIHGGEEFKIDVIDLRLPASRLEKTLETERIILECRIKRGDTVLEGSKKNIELLAYNAHAWSGVPPATYACFVTPNHPVIMQVLKQVRETIKRNTEDNSLDGYQTRDPNKVYEMTKALYETFKDFGISYINPPASFENGYQKIRLADQILIEQMGTCGDLSVLAAACLEQMGLHPLLIEFNNHVLPGVWLEEENNLELIIENPLKLINLYQANSLIFFDSSTYASYPQPPFKEAVKKAYLYLKEEVGSKFERAIDINLAR